MISRKSIFFLIFLTWFLINPPFLFASEPNSGKTKSLTLTIYNHGKALINEIREMKIETNNEPFEIIFEGVPTTIDPTSLQVKSSSPQFRILDQNYEYDLINTKNLLDRYIGKKLKVAIPDLKAKEAGKFVFKEAKLISNNDRPIFEIEKEIYIGSYSSLMLASIPENLRAKPALVWLVENKGPSQQEIEVSYLAGGFNWRADYVLKVERDNKSASLSGWVTLENHSGMTYKEVDLKLVAGELHEAPPEREYMGKDRMLFTKKVAKEEVEEERFFEYHLYSFPRKVTVKNKQTKQISLLQSTNFQINRILKSRNKNPYLYLSSYSGPTLKQHPEIYLEFKNTKENGLGMPLPKGKVRAYQKSSDGSVLLIGEDRIDHTPKNEKVSLKMGEAFDITIERKQKDFEKISRDVYETAWEIEVRNAKEEADQVIFEEYIPGDWKFVSNPDKFKKIASNWIKTTVSIPPEGKKVVRYRVRIKY